MRERTRDVRVRGESRRSRRCSPRELDPRATRPSVVLVRFFTAGIAFLGFGAITGAAGVLTGDPGLRWPALHLLLLGGVSQLVLGAAQFFTCAFLATSPPHRALVWAQLASWNAGTLSVVAGVRSGSTTLSTVGAALVGVGLLLFAGALWGMQRRSLRRARWAVRWYQASAGFLGVGVLIGVAMVRGVVWSDGSLAGGHLALNLAGWLGTAIVGTLHTFFPSLTQTQLRFGRLQGPTFVLWVLGVGSLALGAAVAVDALIVIAWVELALAAVLLSANLLASLAAAPAPPVLAARLVAIGQVFLLLGLVAALVLSATGGATAPFVEPARGALGVLFVAGWVGLTVVGALLHLLAVLARVRHFALAMPDPRPVRDAAVAGAAAVGVGGLALSHTGAFAAIGPPASIWFAAMSAVFAVQVIRLAFRALVGPWRPRMPAHDRS